MPSLLLPKLIASLNAISLFLLLSAFIAVKQKKFDLHKKLILAALVSSTLFLTCYLIHHYQVGSIPYPRHDWTRTVYFLILIPHVILAVGMLPFLVMALRYAFQDQREKHKKIVRWVFPIWVYVSFTGIVVYFMLY